AANTTLVTDRNDDAFRPESCTATPNDLFFLAYDSELWVTDGTAAGTSGLHVFAANSEGEVPRDFVALGNRVVFHVPTDQAVDVWSSDGTPGGTVLLMADADVGSNLSAVLGDNYYFVKGDAIYRTDGTVAGTAPAFTQTGLLPKQLASAVGKLW